MSRNAYLPSVPTISRHHSLSHSRPISPPETDVLESNTLTTFDIQPPSRNVNASIDIGPSRSVRKGSIFYRQGESRDFPKPGETRETRSAAPRWLVVVIPPSLLDLDSTDETLPSDLPKRMSSGVLMPLLPTLYSQLVAIAREFSLPSTSGLRTYLQIPGAAYNATNTGPRITDDVWPMLWRHFLAPTDERAMLNSTHQLPIGGRIEFDIDLRTAKWYNAWARAHEKPTMKFDAFASFSYPPRRDNHIPPAAAGDGETGDHEVEDFPSAVRPPQHMRQLSLLERRARDLPLLPSVSRPSAEPDQPIARALYDAEPAPLNAGSQATSPQATINMKVLNWRQKTPTGIELPEDEAHPLPETTIQSPPALDLNDFTWSISSAGPLTYDPADVLSASTRLSVHMADRAAGSVGLTPTTATSFGPPRSGPLSSVYSFASRHPSPDIAYRMVDNAPCTPTTATSWGPPDDDFGYALPSSPLLRTPDMGERMVSPTIGLHSNRGVLFVHVWPYQRPAGGDGGSPILFAHVWPYQPTPEEPRQSGSSTLLNHDHYGVTSTMCYPDLIIYPSVYPFLEIYPARTATTSSTPRKLADPFQHIDRTAIRRRLVPSSYPTFELYPPVYPYVAQMLYPIVIRPKDDTAPDSGRTIAPVRLVPAYPTFDLYEPVYPHNLSSLYPAVGLPTHHQAQTQRTKSLALISSSKYPFLVIYPNVYPSLVIYPPRAGLTIESVVVDDESFPLSIPPYPYISSSIATPKHAPAWPHFDQPQLQNLMFRNDTFSDNSLVLDHSSGLSPTPIPPSEDGELSMDNDVVFEMDSPARRFALARQRDLQMSPYPSENDLSILDDDDLDDAPWLVTKSPFPEDVPAHAFSLEDNMFDEEPPETFAAADSNKLHRRGTAALRPGGYI